MQVTIKNIVDFYKKYPEYIGAISVKTRFGYKSIQAAGITAKKSDVYLISTKDYKIKTSPDHLMLSNDCEWVKTKDLLIGNFLFDENGPVKIESIRKLKTKKDLYDLQVEEVHEFFANGVVSHNSSLLDAVAFNLFGKPFRNINIPQLVNSITSKNMLTESRFTIGKKKYRVIRGIKPTIFEIYENEKLINQDAAKKDYQGYLEKKILKMSRRSFNQIVILGSANYVPFMQLPAGQRREVIEDLLDIKVFSVMNTLLKERNDQNKDDTKDLNRVIELLEQKIDLHKKHLQELHQNNSDLIEQKKIKLSSYENEISSLDKKNEKYRQEIEELANSIQDSDKITEKTNKLLEMEKDLSVRLKKIDKEMAFFEENDNCPTCKQEINQEFKCNHIDKKSSRYQEISDALVKIDSSLRKLNGRSIEIAEVSKKLSELSKQIADGSIQRKSIDSFMKSIDKEINDLENKKNEIYNDSSDLKTMIRDRKNLDKQKEKLTNQRELFNIAAYLLKDTGIKTKIIKQYIPVINKLINKYLSTLDFFVDFQLSENFQETIKSRYRDDFSYASFSEGEKKRIDLAVLFTWRAIAKMRNSTSCNILILDEILDGPADQFLIENFFTLVKEACPNDNLFMISPKGESFFDKFYSSIKFEKKNNFSSIV